LFQLSITVVSTFIVGFCRLGDEESIAAVRKLDRAFTFELRLLHIIPAGSILFFVYKPAVFVVVSLAGVSILITDALFSVIVSMIFLRPIVHAQRLRWKQAPQRRSRSHKLMARAKWETFVGVALAVASSSVLYINLIVWGAMPRTGPFGLNPWLNPWTFMANLDSVLNDISMLLVSGLLTSGSFYNFWKRTEHTISPPKSKKTRSMDLSGAVNWDRSNFRIAPESFRPIGYSTSSESMSISAMSSSIVGSTTVLDAATVLDGSDVVASPPKSPEFKPPAVTSPPNSPRASSTQKDAKREEQNALMLAILTPPSR
jgi:hypothetical protein